MRVIPDALERRLPIAGVAAQAAEVDRERHALAVGREDGIVDGVENVAWGDLADGAVSLRSHQERVEQERVASQLFECRRADRRQVTDVDRAATARGNDTRRVEKGFVEV